LEKNLGFGGGFGYRNNTTKTFFNCGIITPATTRQQIETRRRSNNNYNLSWNNTMTAATPIPQSQSLEHIAVCAVDEAI